MRAQGVVVRSVAPLALAVVWSACGPVSPETHFQRAERLYEQGRIEPALAEYRTAVTMRPDFALAWSRLAAALYTRGRWSDAAVAAIRAAELEPKVVEIRLRLGIAQLMAGQVAEGDRTLSAVLATVPGEALASFHLEAAKAIEQKRLTPGCYAKLSEAVGPGRTPTDASLAPAYEEVSRTCPEFYRATLNLAHIRLAAGQQADAQDLYKSVVDADPGDAEALAGLGLIAHERGRLDEAASRYRAACEAGSKRPGDAFHLGELYRDLGQAPLATDWLKKALAMDPDGPFAERARALLAAPAVPTPSPSPRP